MSRLDDQNKQTNQLWQQVMKEKMHELEKRFSSNRGDGGSSPPIGTRNYAVSSPPIGTRNYAVAKNNNKRYGGNDAAGLYHRLNEQKIEITRATKTLNEELNKRYTRGPSTDRKQSYNMLTEGGLVGSHAHPGGGSEVIIYKYLEQIRILKDKIDQLRARGRARFR